MSDEMLLDPSAAPPPDPAVPVAARKARYWWMEPFAAGLAGLVLGAGGVGLAWGLSGSESPKSPPRFTLSGSMTLKNPTSLDFNHEACAGSGGYHDIVAGAAVTVYDATGKVVASGSLGSGRYESPDSAAPCVFAVMVPEVPDGSNFYQVEISHRGKLTVSADDAKVGKLNAVLG